MSKLKLTKRIAVDTINRHIPGWRFSFHLSGRAYGFCYFDEKLITVNIEHVRQDCWEEILDTIAHEVGHAICGDEEGEGNIWKSTYMKIKGELVNGKTITRNRQRKT